MQPVALITGICGQDGAYLAQLLQAKGYRVCGTSRDAHKAQTHALQALGVLPHIQLHSLDLTDAQATASLLHELAPQHIYHLAGQSSVGTSFAEPAQTFHSFATSTLNLLEAMRGMAQPPRLFVAGSGECFGDAGHQRISEAMPFAPQSPYAVAKVASAQLVRLYRESYGAFACTGFLFNHESPLRPLQFVTQKIVQGALAIAQGRQKTLELGNIAIARDWGYAPEYVDAMHRMLCADTPEDFIIATGETHSLEALIEAAFKHVGLHWREHVVVVSSLLRPSDIPAMYADPSRIASRLGWRAQHYMPDVVGLMIAGAQASRAA